MRAQGGVQGAELVEAMSAPASVVIVGASAKPGAVAGRSLEYLNRFRFAGEVYVVHPRESAVLGRPAVARIEDLPDDIDVAMLNIAAAAVPDALRALEQRGVKVALSIAGGFETHGDRPREEVLELMATTKLRLIGPNCTGFMTPATSTFLSMSSFLQHYQVPQGGVAIVSQSGGMGNGLLTSLLKRGAGISHLITTGNELNVGCLEIIAGLLPRPEVKAVGVFIEGITDVAWLTTVTELIESTGKPVYYQKTARTDAGRMAAGGHTGRVVGPADVASAILSDAGMREVRDLEQLGDVLVCADLFGTPRGGQVGVVCVSGASAGLAADSIRLSQRLTMAAPSAAARAESQPKLDPRVTFANPLDIGFNETIPISRGMQVMRATGGVDAVVGVVTSLAHDPDVMVEELSKGNENLLPMVLTFLSPEDALPKEHIAALALQGIPVVPTPERAITVLDLLAPGSARDEVVEEGHERQENVVGIEAVADVAVDGDLALAPWEIVGSVEAATAAAERFGYPVVVKVAGRRLQHRTEEGGVAVGVTSERLADVFTAMLNVADRHGDVVMVQHQAAAGFELMLSALNSPEFGPVAIVRPGGVLAELMKAQVILPARWTTEHRLDVLRRSTLGQILNGYRGGRVYDAAAVARLAGVVAEVLVAGSFDFIELNPVIVGVEGVAVVDALAGRRAQAETNH